jgi:hypothetical protein
VTAQTSPRNAVLIGILVAVVAMVVRFPGALPGPRVVSAHDHLSVHPFFQPHGSTGRVHQPHLSDPALQFAALDRRTVESLRAGQAPLWNPDLYGGTPLLGDGQSRPLSPITWFRVLLPEDVAQDVGVAWLFVWLSTGCVLLVRRLVPGGPVVLATAAAVAVTSPYLSVWLLHPHASTVVWLPWWLWAVERRSVGWTALAVFGVCTGGHPGTAAHVFGLVALWWMLRSRRWQTPAGSLAGILLAAPAWLPLWDEVARSTTRSARVGGSLHVSQLLDLLWPGFWGHPARETWTGTGAWADGQLHPGVAALLIGVFALVAPSVRRLRPLVIGVLAVWALGLVASVTGLPGPVAHGRLGSVMALAWVILASVGAQAVATRFPRAGGFVPLLVLLTGTAARWSDQFSIPADAHAPEPAPWGATIVEKADGGRILGLDWAAQPNTAALVGLRDLRGYDLPVSEDTHRLMTALSPRPKGPWYPVDRPPSPTFLKWWDVRLVLAFRDASDAASPAAWAEAAGWTELPLPADTPLHGWFDPTPALAARVVRRTVRTHTADQAAQWLARSTSPDIVSVEATGPMLTGEGPPVPATRQWHGAAKMQLTWDPLADDGLLVVSEAHAPGWRARTPDGTPLPTVRVGGTMLGVPVPAGTSTVELYYRPDGWILGQRLFVGGLLLLGLAAAVGRRRRLLQPATTQEVV